MCVSIFLPDKIHLKEIFGLYFLLICLNAVFVGIRVVLCLSVREDQGPGFDCSLVCSDDFFLLFSLN